MNLDIRAHIGHKIEQIDTATVTYAETLVFPQAESDEIIVEGWGPSTETTNSQVYCKTCDLFLTGGRIV